MITWKISMVTTQDLFTNTDNLIYKIKTEDVYEDFSKDKEMFDFSNYSYKSKYDDDLNKLVVGKMKDETAGVAVREFAGLKCQIDLFLVDDSSEHKKVTDESKKFFASVSYNEYKDVLLNQKCLRHSMNKIQSKNRNL